jgi:hypothetical protein
MKAPSISSNSLNSDLIENNQGSPLFQNVKQLVLSFFKTLDRIGTAIALGESGNLEAAHDFREKHAGR